MNLNNNIEFAKKAEGEVRLSNGCHKLYKCPSDKWTIGYGYNIEDNGLPENIAQILLKRMLGDSVLILESNINCWQNLDTVRKSVLVDMCFNMGWPTLSHFKNMIEAVNVGDYKKASKEMINSKWYRQTGNRSKLLVKSMESGKWQDYS